MACSHYHVIENTPGYLPDDCEPPFPYSTKAAAGQAAYESACELREQGYRVWGNQREGYYGERDSSDLGRNISIVRCCEEECWENCD
jgi:hypothetical protein